MTKLAVEQLGAVYAQDRDLQFIAVRPTRMYGPGRTQGALERMIISYLRGEPFRWLGGPTEELLYVQDEARAFAAAVLTELPNFRVFNACSLQKHSAAQVLEALGLALPGLPLQLEEPLPSLATGTLQPRMDSQRAARELGWSPRITLEEGLDQLVTWLQQEVASGSS
jgi:nucleoside-diphosphate-sugar epimerase